MIDTVKFRVKPSSPEQFETIQKQLAVLEKTKDNKSIFKIHKENIELGSFERGVYIDAQDSGNIFLTFSLPKYRYGHNIDLLYGSDIPYTLTLLYIDLNNYFHTFPSFETWELQRLDICYAWKLPSQSIVIELMKLIRSFEYSRKKPYVRDTSIMFIGSAYSVKFYQKYEEYYANDFKAIRDKDPDRAEQLLTKALGVLRFEVSMKRSIIEQEFGKHSTYTELLNEVRLENLLNKYLSTYFKGLKLEFDAEKDIYDKLVGCYGITRGVQLYQFYLAYFGESKLSKALVQGGYSRAQIYKNLQSIKKAQVGVSKKEHILDFDFSIPSKDVVNERPPGSQ